MEHKLSDSELAIMQILWNSGEMRATEIAEIAGTKYGWEKNTGYTFLHRLIKKGAVTRRDPGFYCTAACERDALLSKEATDMVNKLYSGSIGSFVSSFFNGKAVSKEDKEVLQRLIDKHTNGGV